MPRSSPAAARTLADDSGLCVRVLRWCARRLFGALCAAHAAARKATLQIMRSLVSAYKSLT